LSDGGFIPRADSESGKMILLFSFREEEMQSSVRFIMRKKGLPEIDFRQALCFETSF